jgi:hypothetical protein
MVGVKVVEAAIDGLIPAEEKHFAANLEAAKAELRML